MTARRDYTRATVLARGGSAPRPEQKPVLRVRLHGLAAEREREVLPIGPAFREYRLKARVMELRAEAAERQAEIEAMFARIMSNPSQFETVGEPMPHNIKFLG